MADELATIQALGARHVFIVDAVFNLTNEHVVGICEAILRQGMKLGWTCFLRPKNLTAELLRLMARAGLTHIEFGSDSFCDEVLAQYGKTFSFDDIASSSELARSAGIHCSHFVICGGPGETSQTLATTFVNSRRLTNAVIFALPGMRIYPGTPLFSRALQEGQISTKTDLLQPTYYLPSSLSPEELLEALERFRTQASNWIVDPLPPSFNEIARRLRQRGVVGPLWEYFGALRRQG